MLKQLETATKEEKDALQGNIDTLRQQMKALSRLQSTDADVCYIISFVVVVVVVIVVVVDACFSSL
jgi:t-SNARE complex subunit (syntaxin)